MPPKGFRLVWTRQGARDLGFDGGAAVLWTAPNSALFADAYRAGQSQRLWVLGFSRGMDAANFWEKPGFDPEIAAAEIHAITLEIKAWRTKRRIKARAKAEKDAAVLADLLRRRATAKVDLHRVMTERRWAIHHSFVDRARYLHGLHVLPDDLADEAARIVKSTDDTVDRATANLNEPAPEASVVFCGDHKVREAIGVALRKITSTDEDWATFKNHIGWSKATTVRGHVLSMHERLSPNLAGHAMVLLHIHRTQVAAEIKAVLGMAED